jgi:Fe-S cluster assembly iron-binding protein IscA
MLAVTDSASTQLQTVLDSEQAKNKHLVIFFQGHG